MRVNYICCKWGTKYSPEFVNRLYRMAKKHTPENFDFHFYCYTDNSEGFESEIIGWGGKWGFYLRVST